MSKGDPAATDLDYYSKPENYTGSNLQAFHKFVADKTKEEKASQVKEKKRVIKDAKYHFFNRYKHILHDVIFIDELLGKESDDESSSDDDDEADYADKLGGRKSTAPDVLMTITETDEKEGREGETLNFATMYFSSIFHL